MGRENNGRTKGPTKVRGALRRESRRDFRLLIERLQGDPAMLQHRSFVPELTALHDLLNEHLPVKELAET
jgi:hypothetical protein